MTTARRSVEADRNRRMRNYLIAMGVRIVGFPVSVWLLLHGFVVLGVVLAAGATVMPSIAVVVANAVDRRGASSEDAAPVSPVQGLGPAPDRDGQADAPPAQRDETITGTVVSSHDTPYPTPRQGGPDAGPDEGATGHPDREAS